jgi:hypothetical protein
MPPDAPALLQLLRASIVADAGAPGVTGALAVGVGDAERGVWWLCVGLGARAVGDLVFGKPEKPVDAWLLLNAASAESICASGTLTGNPPDDGGDVRLLHSFMKRYLVRLNPLQLRLAR